MIGSSSSCSPNVNFAVSDIHPACKINISLEAYHAVSLLTLSLLVYQHGDDIKVGAEFTVEGFPPVILKTL
jgi:hypothetical protein